MSSLPTAYEKSVRKLQNNKIAASVLLGVAVIGGTATLIKSVDDARLVFLGDSEIELVQFTLDTTASPFFESQILRGAFDIYNINENNAITNHQIVSIEGVTAWKISEKWSGLGIVPVSVESFNELAESEGIKKALSEIGVSDVSAALRGIDPVLDVTFLNKTNQTMVITGIQSILECYSSGGDVGEEIAVAPLGVSHRYRLDVHSDRPIPALPPISIPPNKAMRMQVQLTNQGKTTGGWFNTSHLLKLRFIFGNDGAVDSPRFEIEHGGGIGTTCPGHGGRRSVV